MTPMVGTSYRLGRVEVRVEAGPLDTPCHVWQGALMWGYPIRRINYVRRAEHRRVWEEANGPIPDGHDIHHICGERRCINPDHLEAITRSEPGTPVVSGAEMIAAERKRQIKDEKWSPWHDDTHLDGELANAAATYAMTPELRALTNPWPWPWDDKWWKPSGDRIRDLVKAGALIAAEIDRLQRRHRTMTPEPDDRSGEEKGANEALEKYGHLWGEKPHVYTPLPGFTMPCDRFRAYRAEGSGPDGRVYLRMDEDRILGVSFKDGYEAITWVNGWLAGKAAAADA
jgi:hypothetical protein